MAQTPHILLIISDEHRGQAMGHAGDGNLQTPVMDGLAAAGVSFTSACANCPICTPSRGTIFSGRHAHAGPVQGFWDVYKATAPSIAGHLRGQGYHTAFMGKWHMGVVRDQRSAAVRAEPQRWAGESCRTPERHRAGFQDWFGFENINSHFGSYYYAGSDSEPTAVDGYETDGFTDLAIDYIRSYQRSEPLFLTLSVTPPHFPLTVPERWQRLDPEALALRPNVDPADPSMRQRLATYYAMIENLDWNIGRLREALAATSGFEDCLLVYVSDHGDFMGSHGRAEQKELPHEESIRIPAIFHHPSRVAAQGNRDDLFSLVDLVPTICGLCDLPQPVWCQGVDCSPALRGEPFAGPTDILLEMQGNPRWNMGLLDWRGIRTDRWKYAYYEDGREELFDLQADPYERCNLADAQPAQRQAMQRLLLERLHTTREPFFDVLITSGQSLNAPDIDVAADQPRNNGLPVAEEHV